MPTFEKQGSSIFYEKIGNGQTLVFIHGLFMNHNSWRHVTALLRKDYQIISYDLRGHGGSPRGNHPVTIEQLVQDLRCFLTGLGIEKPILVGYSVGAVVALQYAIEYPDTLSALVCSGAFTSSLRHVIGMDLRLSKIASKLRLKGLLANVIAKAHATSGTEFRLFVHLIKQCNLQACREIIESMEKVDLSTCLQNITVPALLIYGSQERMVFQQEIDILMSQIPNCTKKVIQGVAHGVSTKKSEEFALCLQEFINHHQLESL